MSKHSFKYTVHALELLTFCHNETKEAASIHHRRAEPMHVENPRMFPKVGMQLQVYWLDSKPTTHNFGFKKIMCYVRKR